jgi:hypothetical protein
LLGLAGACLLGVSAPLAVFGYGVVAPSNTRWILAHPFSRDPAQYWLAWDYFRRAAWSWPPAQNPDFGLEVASSVFYADAIPLLALLLKALRPLLDVPQYWGAWLMLCGVLQGAFAWASLGTTTRDPLVRVAAAGLRAWQPMLLWRAGLHFSLAAQFLLTAALFLYLRRAATRRQDQAWCALLLATSLVHSYLLVMVAAVWFAGWVDRQQAMPFRQTIAEAAAVGLTIPAGLWLGGFFALGEGLAGGDYGRWRMDLLAPIDGGGWSLLLPDLPNVAHSEAASSYLGAGSLLLILLGGIVALRRRWIRPGLSRHAPLLRVLLLMTLFAITHQVTLLGQTLFTVPLPSRLLNGLSMLRASERFFWPLAYATLLAAMLVLARAFGRRAGPVLLALLLLQVADISPGIVALRRIFAAVPAQVPPQAQDAVWTEAAKRYVRLRAVPTANEGADWATIGRLANELRLPTDSVYLARMDGRILWPLAERVQEAVRSGRYEPGTLYILRDEEARRFAEEGLDRSRDLLREVDGFLVLAPGWFVTPAAAPAP